HRIKESLNDADLRLYVEIMGSLCLTMKYDIFDFHDQYYGTTQHTDRAGYIVSELMNLLSTGICRTEREMRYYAERLHVSPKYLSATVRRMTGRSVTSYIDGYAVPLLKDFLDDHRLSITQICEMMNFTTLSYFSRYCKKHLGMSPQEYRKSLQPK
ncbi:MAG: AraC family transcriptional regulator, partial [Bacteroidales bacterium]|nr:AraC family transcriptional regulator [Bacteroidales bacterium]